MRATSISRNAAPAIAGYLAKLLTAGTVKRLEKKVEIFFKRMHFWGSQVLRIAKRFKVLLFPGMLFEEMGFAYLGPVDGHDVFGLIEILSNVKQLKGPVLLHIITKKGKGYTPAENEPTKFHGIGRFNIITGEPEKKSGAPSYTQVFSQTIVRLAKEDEKIVGITAAMSEGTGLEEFARLYPGRFYDVGIAEGHALTFAAGLACEGLRPVCSIYSTFLQRGLDQIIHDIALQKLPVIIAIDRAGIVGEDGATHQGSFDLSFLRFIPGLTIMAPGDENELQHMLKTALEMKAPVAIRYPRGSGTGVILDKELKVIEKGKSRLMADGSGVMLVALGSTVQPSLEAAKLLKSRGIDAGVLNMRYLKPLDVDILETLSKRIKRFAVIEENSAIGGLGGAVCEYFSESDVKVLKLGLPDIFIEHGSQKILRDKYGLTPEKIAENITGWMNNAKI